jgi:hypothetical protein
MLQWLYTYVANVCSQCFYFFSDVCCKCIYLDVAYVSHIRCKCFIWILHMFKWFWSVFASVSEACFKCFICLLLYIVSVSSGCFKSRSGECSGSQSSQCGSNFRLCFSPPRWLVAVGRPHPYSSGQRRLEEALGWVPPGGTGPTWACEMVREADCRRRCPDASSVRTFKC